MINAKYLGLTANQLAETASKLDAENERLIDACEAWIATSNRLDAENAKLRRENAELRKLVRELWEGYMDPSCEDCPLKDTPTCADCPICAREASVIDRMRELGVEVDG